MSSIQKSRPHKEIFGLTLDDSIWRDQTRTSLRSNDWLEQMLYQTLLVPKKVSHVQQKSKQVNTFFQYGFPSLLELMKPVLTQGLDAKLQENNSCYSLFQYDLLCSKRNNDERSETQICPLDLPKPSRKVQRQMNDNVSYIRPTGTPNMKPLRKTVQFNCADERFNGTSGVSTLMDKSVQPDSSKLNQPNKMFMFEKNIQLVNSSNNDVNKLRKQSNARSMQKSSSLTVEKVRSILKFYHTTSKGLIEKKERENFSDDEEDSLDNINNVKLFKCAQCDKEYPNKSSRKIHVRHDLNYVCKSCNNVSSHVRQIQLHEEKTHGVLSRCYVTISRKRRPRQRRSDSGATRNYYCCGQTFKAGREFGLHKSTHKFMINRN
ncbi:6502_t:CDS:2 [Funneliformis caledonium]|uniref:6502_t:CDS:1 n=1 Tax=Funneliformis caledonium TaxID=1117310 RepID=A0A9N9AAI9_9GLOM|nr:6502_t:CDS:2 [Funneliformis caledonium]